MQYEGVEALEPLSFEDESNTIPQTSVNSKRHDIPEGLDL
jgi:hypothetical protein